MRPKAFNCNLKYISYFLFLKIKKNILNIQIILY